MTKAGSSWQKVCTRAAILALQPELTLLAERCGQPSMMGSLDYFLSIPHLDARPLRRGSVRPPSVPGLMAKVRNKLPRLLIDRDEDGLKAAALLFEHEVCGISTGIFIPVNGDVYRTVVAPAEKLAAVTREVGEFLMRHGGVIALLSYLEAPGCSPHVLTDPARSEFWEAGHLMATDRRESSCRLPLGRTFDETLAGMGPHTRRNLRAYQRRAVRELGATYEPKARVSLAEFLEMNATGKYAVTEGMARWRYEMAQDGCGGTMSGLRAGDGTWLSLIGSHAQAETVWLRWQMNREVSGSFSLVSAMRSFFISTQVDLGMRWIHFEGGTPHTMRNAFVKEQARDLLFARKLLSPSVLKQIAPGFSTIGPLASFLRADTLIWRR